MLIKKKRTKFTDAYDAYGRTVGLATFFSVSRAAVSQWKIAGGFPPKRALQIEADSKGRYKAIDIVEPGELVVE